MSEPSLADYKEKYDAAYKLFRHIAEMQLSFSLDKTRAKGFWIKALKEGDNSVLADVLSDFLADIALKSSP